MDVYGDDGNDDNFGYDDFAERKDEFLPMCQRLLDKYSASRGFLPFGPWMIIFILLFLGLLGIIIFIVYEIMVKNKRLVKGGVLLKFEYNFSEEHRGTYRHDSDNSVNIRNYVYVSPRPSVDLESPPPYQVPHTGPSNISAVDGAGRISNQDTNDNVVNNVEHFAYHNPAQSISAQSIPIQNIPPQNISAQNMEMGIDKEAVVPRAEETLQRAPDPERSSDIRNDSSHISQSSNLPTGDSIGDVNRADIQSSSGDISPNLLSTDSSAYASSLAHPTASVTGDAQNKLLRVDGTSVIMPRHGLNIFQSGEAIPTELGRQVSHPESDLPHSQECSSESGTDKILFAGAEKSVNLNRDRRCLLRKQTADEVQSETSTICENEGNACADRYPSQASD